MSDTVNFKAWISADQLIEELRDTADQRGSLQAPCAFFEALGVSLWDYFDQKSGQQIVDALTKAFERKHTESPHQLPKETP